MGSVLNIKNKMASLSLIFPVGAGYNAGGIGLSREARKPTLWPKSVAFKRTRATGSHNSKLNHDRGDARIIRYDKVQRVMSIHTVPNLSTLEAGRGPNDQDKRFF